MKCKQNANGETKKGILQMKFLAVMLGIMLLAGNEKIMADGHEGTAVNSSASRVKWSGAKVVGGKHSGTIDIRSGKIRKTKEGFSGNIVLDMTSLTATDLTGTDRKKLNGHLKSDDFFAVKKYPTAKFVITKATLRKGNEYDVTGKLTIKKITKNSSFVAKVTFDKKSGAFKKAAGTMVFDRTEFGVKYNSGKFFENLADKVIKDEVIIKFRLRP